MNTVHESVKGSCASVAKYSPINYEPSPALSISIYSWKDNIYSTDLNCMGSFSYLVIMAQIKIIMLELARFSASNTPCADTTEVDLIFNYSSLSSVEHLKDLRSDSEADVSPWPLRRLPVWFPTSHGGSALRATRFTTQWTLCLGVKGQEPRARPQPQKLTVMLKDHTQQADLWGLHRAWAGLSNKAVYGLSVYLCPAPGTWFTAYYSKTTTQHTGYVTAMTGRS